MLVLANQSTNQTIALLITFVGIGVLVNVLVIYIIAQVLAERRDNQERQQRLNR
jgi:phage shock protein PspC (stress-responsive transcriptional regulator)